MHKSEKFRVLWDAKGVRHRLSPPMKRKRSDIPGAPSPVSRALNNGHAEVGGGGDAKKRKKKKKKSPGPKNNRKKGNGNWTALQKKDKKNNAGKKSKRAGFANKKDSSTNEEKKAKKKKKEKEQKKRLPKPVDISEGSPHARFARYVGMDCEMVGIGPQRKSALARCSVVDFNGEVRVLSGLAIIPPTPTPVLLSHKHAFNYFTFPFSVTCHRISSSSFIIHSFLSLLLPTTSPSPPPTNTHTYARTHAPLPPHLLVPNNFLNI